MLEPSDFKIHKKRPKKLILLIVFILILGIWYIKFERLPKIAVNEAENTKNQQQVAAESISRDIDYSSKTLKIFSPDEFKDLYRNVFYPNTQAFNSPPPITDNLAADVHIRTMAEARGYRLTSIPISAIVKIDEPRLSDDNLLQPLAAQAWQEIKSAAHQAKKPLSLISAFRSPQYQRSLFMERLLAHRITVSDVAAGKVDQAVADTLHMTAVPGYSRHHTGYTVDMWCEDGSGSFISSSCYKWLSSNNYAQAKSYGWIPSYPEGAKDQGPEPEAWEYVWVGKAVLYQ